MLRDSLTALKARPLTVGALAAAFGAGGLVVGGVVDWNASIAKPAIPCAGEYADTFEASRQTSSARKPAEYTYLVRNTATYECPYFGPDGKLRRRPVSAKEDGTAFAYEVIGEETYLVTNEHVAVWPDVTDSRNRVPGVSEGCKRVEARLRIVDDLQGDDELSHTPLKLVASDTRLDAAILKASKRLTVLPYRIGKSAAIRSGNAVEVRGYPLGLLHAVNTGKVVNPYDLDLEQGWNHVDFVIDALLSEGNSGSPVLALHCGSGRLELVGMYHAGYKEASALNVVVGIDQLRELMTKKRRIPRATADGPALTGVARRRLEERLAPGTGGLPLFEFGGMPVLVERADGLLRYHLYGRDFPIDDQRVAVVEDRPGGDRFGELGRILVRGTAGWRQFRPAMLGEDERDLLTRLADSLRLHLLNVLEYRRLTGSGDTVAMPDRRRAREIRKTLERQTMPERELVGAFTDLVERLAPSRETPVASGSGVDGGVPAAPALHAAPVPGPL